MTHVVVTLCIFFIQSMATKYVISVASRVILLVSNKKDLHEG